TTTRCPRAGGPACPEHPGRTKHASVVFVAVDVDDVAVRRADEEPSDAPGFRGGWVDDLVPASLRFLVRVVDVVADGDGDRGVVGSGRVTGDQLYDRLSVWGLEPGDPVHANLLVAEAEVVRVEVASFADVWDGEVREDVGGS